MSLSEYDTCTGSCPDCSECDTILVKKEDLEKILSLALCDEIRELVASMLHGR